MEREKKCPLNFHCFESPQFNDSYILDPCFVYTFSFQNTKNTLFGRLVIFSLYINRAHPLLPQREEPPSDWPAEPPCVWSCLLSCVLSKLCGHLSVPLFKVVSCTADHRGVTQDHPDSSLCHLTQPSITREGSLSEGLSGSSWPACMLVRMASSKSCGRSQPTVGRSTPQAEVLNCASVGTSCMFIPLCSRLWVTI